VTWTVAVVLADASGIGESDRDAGATSQQAAGYGAGGRRIMQPGPVHDLLTTVAPSLLAGALSHIRLVGFARFGTTRGPGTW
jgi:hypothetical protein